MPSRNVVLANAPGGVATPAAGVPTIDQDTPPSVERSTEMVASNAPGAGLNPVSVVYTVPPGATGGSRDVAPCAVGGGGGTRAGRAPSEGGTTTRPPASAT